MTSHKKLEIIKLTRCDSTNNYIKNHYQDIKDKLPVLVTAAQQTGGRGRDNRSWLSTKKKGMYSSFAFSLDSNRYLFLLPLIAGISVIKTLEKTAGTSTTPDAKFGLKWPNDILYQGKKIAGILIENTIFDQRMFCITGIGINLNHEKGDFPPQLTDKAVSLKMITGLTYKAETMNTLLAAIFFEWLEKAQHNGKEIIQTADAYTLFLKGQRISFHQGPEKIITGIFRGINHDGGLRLETGDGDIVNYYSGEIV